MSSVKLRNLTGHTLSYVSDHDGSEVILESEDMAVAEWTDRKIGELNKSILMFEQKFGIKNLPPPESSTLFLVDKEVFRTILIAGSRIDVVGVDVPRGKKKGDAVRVTLEGVLCGNWVRGKHYFNPLAHEQTK